MSDEMTLEPARASALRRTSVTGSYEFTTHDGGVHRTSKCADGQVTVTPPLRGVTTFKNLVALEIVLGHRDPTTRQYVRRDPAPKSQTRVKGPSETRQTVKAHIEPVFDVTLNPAPTSVEALGGDVTSTLTPEGVDASPLPDVKVAAPLKRDRYATDSGVNLYVAGLIDGQLRLLVRLGQQVVDVFTNEAWLAWPGSFEFKRHYGLGCGRDVEQAIVKLFKRDFGIEGEVRGE